MFQLSGAVRATASWSIECYITFVLDAARRVREAMRRLRKRCRRVGPLYGQCLGTMFTPQVGGVACITARVETCTLNTYIVKP